MKKLHFNRQTLKGEQRCVTSILIEVSDDFSISKTVQVEDGETQLKDENGESLYWIDRYVTEEYSEFKYFDETIEETDKPCMIEMHKVDNEGNRLYTENIYGEDGEVVDTFETTKEISESGEKNKPIIESVQKLSDGGKPLFLTPVYEVTTHEVYDRTEKTTEVTDKPVMIPTFKDVVVEINANPEYFEINECLGAHYLETLNGTRQDYVIADMFLNEDDLDMDKTYANTGTCICQLPGITEVYPHPAMPLKKGRGNKPQVLPSVKPTMITGIATTKPIALAEPAKLFIVDTSLVPRGIELKINGVGVEGYTVTLNKPVSEIVISFENKTKKPIDLKSYAIFYSKEVI